MSTPPPDDDRHDRERRRDDRRRIDRRLSRRLPVLSRPEETAGGEAKPAVTGLTDGAIEAQLMGQTGARKGLRGGSPVLNAARSAYLGNEYSGSRDRRPKPGGEGDTEA